ncbi:hypothetical protein [Nocardioides conyzicola]|uniref:Uncharacterized protein n=1 Tax=Nocardioides conyzicola TaxID=1651781 RepID=A0ABP8XHM2_9ACTN
MSTDIDEWIGTEVERSFGTEPPLRDPLQYAVRGRRAARRRRAAVAASVGVAAVAVGAFAASIGGAGSAGRDVEPAGPPGVVPVHVTDPVPVDPDTARECRAGTLGDCGLAIGWDDIHLDDHGKVVRGYPEVKVTGYYDHVLGDAFGTSAALEVVTTHGDTVWLLLTATRDHRISGFQSELPDQTRTFDEWVADSVGSHSWFSYPELPPAGGTSR